MGFKKRAGMRYGGPQPHGKDDRRQGTPSMENLSNTRIKQQLAEHRKEIKIHKNGNAGLEITIKRLEDELKRREKFKKK